MHRFTAVTACAVLDVLGPPYSDPEGRHCTYYSDDPFSAHSGTFCCTIPCSSLAKLRVFWRRSWSDESLFHIFIWKLLVDGVTVAEREKGGYAWLKEREKPEDLEVVGGEYEGPKIAENWRKPALLYVIIQSPSQNLSPSHPSVYIIIPIQFDDCSSICAGVDLFLFFSSSCLLYLFFLLYGTWGTRCLFVFPLYFFCPLYSSCKYWKRKKWKKRKGTKISVLATSEMCIENVSL